MRCISRAARSGSEQIESGSPIATISENCSASSCGMSTMSATTAVAFFSRGLLSSFSRTCSIIFDEWSTNVVANPLLSSFKPHLPVPQPRSQHAAVESRGRCGLIDPPGQLVVKMPVRVVVDRVVLPRDAVVVAAGAVAGIAAGHGGVIIRRFDKLRGVERIREYRVTDDVLPMPSDVKRRRRRRRRNGRGPRQVDAGRANEPLAEPPSAKLLARLFIIPLLIVAAAVGIMFIIGRMAGANPSFEEALPRGSQSGRRAHGRSADRPRVEAALHGREDDRRQDHEGRRRPGRAGEDQR